MVILGLDYGEKRIGAAISDPLEIAATALDTIERTPDESEFDEIARLVGERNVELVVVGLPLRMDGSAGIQARKARSFAKQLRRRLSGVQVETTDERLSSAQAHRVLSEAGATNRVRRRNVDAMSAQLILNRYLQRRSLQKKRNRNEAEGDADELPPNQEE